MEKIIKSARFNLCILFLMTSVHHVYGGIIYESSWRIWGILWSLLYFIPMIIFISFYRKKLCNDIACVMSFLWVLVIGFYEGGYNHVLKNILYKASSNTEMLSRFFPKEFGYKVPNDFFFELTGIATFVEGIICFGQVYIWWKLKIKKQAV